MLSTIAKEIWQPIDPRNFGCDVSVLPPPVRTDSGGGGGEFQDTRRGLWLWRTSSFLGGKPRSSFRRPVFFLPGNGMTTVAFEKEVLFKTLACLAKRFSSTEVKSRT